MMSEKKAAGKLTRAKAKSATAASKKSEGFTDEERTAMKEPRSRAKGCRAQNKDKAAGENAVVAQIAAMREIGSRFWASGSMRSSRPAA